MSNTIDNSNCNFEQFEFYQRDFSQEVKLPEKINLEFDYEHALFRNILLTGATGFFGAYLLVDLLEETTANIYCLIRSSSEEQARVRLEDNLKKYGLFARVDFKRIHFVLGDLSQKNFGWKTNLYEDLSNCIDVIYHSGASVVYFRSYTTMKSVNVDGTIEILLFACRNKTKPVHYVSSFSIARSAYYRQKSVIYEEPIYGKGMGIKLGYIQSKWVAESICEQARLRGLPISIYRPGIISGSQKSGVMNHYDFIVRVLLTCVLLQKAPITSTYVHFTPVDYCSKAMVKLSINPNNINRYFHLVNENPILWSDLFKWINAQGYDVEMIPVEDWWAFIATNINSKNLVAPLFMTEKGMRDKVKNWKEIDIFSCKFDCSNVNQGMANDSIECLSVKELLEVYFLYFIKSGMI
ncbi:thioester reductase domain-containing protein [Candidatus Uabimicrobium sp. HlEnr_7]|uniref:thioester reductase domain-containing protein n=1 Tax=Candidatus Uabimicrobium helgolandensis TaxID=3095367 RepID=UPI0035569F89